MAELFALRETLSLFSSSQWVNSNHLEIECGNLNVVKWLSNPGTAPWRFKSLMLHIENLKLKIKSWSISQIYRESNIDTDALAKAGVQRTEDLFEVFSVDIPA